MEGKYEFAKCSSTEMLSFRCVIYINPVIILENKA